MNQQKAYFAAGCFWGPQPAFSKLDGVLDTRVGYCGGDKKAPTYQQVCSGNTGHAETVEVTFDPTITSYETLLEEFWNMHDPNQLNRQGPDVGTQYRSAIFTDNQEQYELANESKSKWDKANPDKPATTVIEPVKNFYEAEQYHQNYVCKRETAQV